MSASSNNNINSSKISNSGGVVYGMQDNNFNRNANSKRIRKRFASSRQYLAAIKTGNKKAHSYTQSHLKQTQQQSTQRKTTYNYKHIAPPLYLEN